MKSISLKLEAVLFIIGFMILGNGEVWGADWKYLVRTDEEAVSYDTESVTRPSRDTVRVSVKTVFSEKGINMHVKEFGERFENLNHVKDLLEFNCVDKKTRVLQSTIYSKDGNILVSDTSSELEWRVIIPDSLGETLYKEVCE
jgi:hypothetical protein